MASVAASVIGAPITGVLIILEMTMNYEYALLAMMSITSVLISNLILDIHSLIASFLIVASMCRLAEVI